jgi:hypothetical protein
MFRAGDGKNRIFAIKLRSMLVKMVVKSNKIPDKSIILNGFGKMHYCDSYRIAKQTGETVDEITTQIFKMPRWITALMNIRNVIGQLVGLRVGNNEGAEKTATYPVGAKAGYFTVIARSVDEIVMGEDDRHLYFRVSVLVDRERAFIYLTTVVQFHNGWGRLYFLLVKPFHRLIIKSIMGRQVQK